MTQFPRLERQYLKAAAALDDARRDGELTDDEYADEHSRLTLAYEKKIDDVAEQIAAGESSP